MKQRGLWKRMLGLSLTLLVLLAVFTVGIWAMGNATGAMASAIMGYNGTEGFGYRYLPLDDFLLGSIGSPMFYVWLADLAALVLSAGMLIIKPKSKC